MSTLSTYDVARIVGISRSTLQLWLAAGVVKPKRVRVGKKDYWLWAERDLARLKVHKAEFYCKGRGRKPKKRRK